MPNPYLAVAAIILGVALLQLANGALLTFLPVRLTLDSYSAGSIGLIATGHAAGFLVGCLTTTRIIRQVGHIRAFAVFAAMMSATAIAFSLWIDPVYWMGLRIITGFCSAGLFTVAESWLAERTPAALRGRVLSVYMIFNKVGFAGGQLMLAVGDVAGLAFYMGGAALYALCLIPVALTTSTSPSVPDIAPLRLRELYRIAPAGVVGCFATGLINSAVISLSPVYGARLGLSTTAIAILMAITQAGSLAFQWPLGWLSDRIDRRHVIVGCTAAVALVSLLLGFVPADWLGAIYLLFALWGGFALSVYAVCVAHANDFSESGRTVQLSSSLLLCWALGSAVGPTLATLMMDRFGPGGLFQYAALVAAGLALFVLWRTTKRASIPAAEREPFVNVPATSPIAMDMEGVEEAADREADAEGTPAGEVR